MESIRGYRAMSMLCRQRAALRPGQSSTWLDQAKRWEQMAEAEIAAHFQACNTDYSHTDQAAS